MSRFVITIAPDNADADRTASAQTTVRVDTSSGQTRITELTVRAADGGGLAPADLPAVDLELLIRALAAPPAVRPLPATDASAPPSPSGVVHFASPDELTEHVEPPEVAAGQAATGAPAGPAGRPRPRRRAAAGNAGGRKAAGRKASGRKAAGRAATKATAAKATATKATGSKATGGKAAGARATGARATGARAAGVRAAGGKAAAKATGRGRKAAAAGARETRAYRRMPDPAEVLAAYAQAGSITALAQHYGVPRHTANGWARRLRREGHSIGRS